MTPSHSRAALSVAILGLLLTSGCNRSDYDAPKDASTPQAATPAADAAPAAATPAAKPATDLEQLAQRLVTQSAAVKEGEVVLISGQARDAELMENIAVEVRRAGGFPFVEYSSDRLDKRLFFDVPDKYDTQANALGLKLAEMIDANIILQNGTSENLFEGADPKRMAARGKANEPVGQAFLKNNVRTIEVGNNLYPAAWRAQRYGLAEDALTQMFWNGVNLDYSQLQARGEQVKTALAGGKEVHVTHPNGTDLTVGVAGRPVLVSDGIISAQDMAAGGAAASVYLPAGEVYTTPVPGTAKGKLVSSRMFFRGKQIDNLTLTLADGKVTAMTGSGPGFADFKAQYDAVDDARKDQLAFLDLGINPNIVLPADNAVGTWVPAGTITLGTGNNMWAGGDNAVAYSLVLHLPGSTVTLDGKPVIEGGSLKL
ncbi:aminopeptidase [Agrilutibacter solisilvae]|uniref:Aminopeptidase n=1 Tax=Agrilutibacter solisilvae TaxID=2763317 RepID=A0A974Y4I6_9GAMM|nr:aminopeptidase [Lysobacter solisilvae]QSX77821.1 aminopeptidase [Lysobacter solisilvae]